MDGSDYTENSEAKRFFPSLTKRKIAIMGYGNQGRAQALNLRDSGIKNLVIGLREGSPTAKSAHADGLNVLTIESAVAWADSLVLLIPDEQQQAFYNTYLASHLKQGSTLVFAHGFAIHFGLISPPPHVDVIMVTPKGTGYGLRRAYEECKTFPCLWGIFQDYSGEAKAQALAYAEAAVGINSYFLETTFHEECVANIFNEHALLGGLSGLIQATFDTIVNSGISPQIAYLETVNGLKTMTTLLHERGISGMNKAISNTAEYASYKGQEYLVTNHMRTAMAHLMREIEAGKFTQQWMDDHSGGLKNLLAARHAMDQHPIEHIGFHVRSSLNKPQNSL